MTLHVALLALLAVVGALGYLPHDAGPKEHFISDALLREVVEKMSKDLVDTPDSYLDFSGQDPNLPFMSRAKKELESDHFDYDSLTDGIPNPSLRNQEQLQDNAVWGFLNGLFSNVAHLNGGSLKNQHIRPGPISHPVIHMKTDTGLPAYCNPPNPCPIGYSDGQGCITNFENTAEFSHEYQSEQECMCDREHMFACPEENNAAEYEKYGRNYGDRFIRTDANLNHLQIDEHKNLVAKKFHVEKSQNPYLSGEKLPVAAKKGINVDMDFD
ncbi:neuroendocrine protein 7B2-like [Arctopsyche grandis]|uniref:neuroendocrine protein 7B2-like n=1 Tax=Arctopsyche grandis TaxID=121162 RepID=UPI00406D9FAC